MCFRVDSSCRRVDSNGIHPDSAYPRPDSNGFHAKSACPRVDSTGIDSDSVCRRPDSVGIHLDSTCLRPDSSRLRVDSVPLWTKIFAFKGVLANRWSERGSVTRSRFKSSAARWCCGSQSRAPETARIRVHPCSSVVKHKFLPHGFGLKGRFSSSEMAPVTGLWGGEKK